MTTDEKKQGGVVDTVVCNPGGPGGWGLIALAVGCWWLMAQVSPSPWQEGAPLPMFMLPLQMNVGLVQ